MQYTLALLGLASAVMAKPMPAAVTSLIPAPGGTPSGCNPSPSGSFQITTVNVTTSTKRDLERRQDGGLAITIQDGVMKDQDGYTGYIASNHQFQFDKPPQAGAIYTSGFSLCSNNTIALGGSTIFYSCLSGSFSNIYDESQGGQCSQVFISASGAGANSGSSGSSASASASAMPTASASPAPSAAGSASQAPDAQPQGATSAAASSAVTQISDMQPQAATSAAASSAITQISDMQPQAATSAAASSAVTQISDHQPQAPTAAGNFSASATPAAYTAGAVANRPEVLALAAGAVALLF